jgi:hypothetical protein
VEQAKRVRPAGNADDHAVACRKQALAFEQSQQMVLWMSSFCTCVS